MEEYQPELFNNLNRKKRSTRKFKKHLFHRNNIRFNLSYEQLGLFIISFVILLSVIFTLGVERGKRISSNIKLTQKANYIKNSDEEGKKQSVVKETSVNKKNKKIEEKALKDYFTIQVVTYRRESLVKSELSYLRKKGYKPFVISSGRLKHICIGKFTEKEKAKSLLKQLRQRYKDCFVKKVK